LNWGLGHIFFHFFIILKVLKNAKNHLPLAGFEPFSLIAESRALSTRLFNHLIEFVNFLFINGMKISGMALLIGTGTLEDLMVKLGHLN
jgi:hypothetical protein